MDLSGETGTAAPDAAPGTLIERLQALYDADRATLELIALGRPAIPFLAKFLCRREPSGLYQPRVHAVAALSALGAEDMLLEFLRNAPRVDISDPVERTGEDAVINAAARALAHRRDDAVFSALIDIAAWKSLPSVVEALGEMRRKSTIPYLISGLASDFCRSAAEIALAKLGAAARPALIELASLPIPSAEGETASSVRTRRSAVRVLREVGLTAEQWSVLRALIWEPDEWLSALACSIGLDPGRPPCDREAAIHRILQLLHSPDWLLTIEIEDWLLQNYEISSRVVAAAIERGDELLQSEKVRRSLRDVSARIGEANRARDSQKIDDG